MRSKWIILKQTYLCYFFIIHHDPFPNALWMMMIFTYKWQQGLLTQLFDHITMIRLFFIFYYLQIRKPLKHLFCCCALLSLFYFNSIIVAVRTIPFVILLFLFLFFYPSYIIACYSSVKMPLTQNFSFHLN